MHVLAFYTEIGSCWIIATYTSFGLTSHDFNCEMSILELNITLNKTRIHKNWSMHRLNNKTKRTKEVIPLIKKSSDFTQSARWYSSFSLGVLRAHPRKVSRVVDWFKGRTPTHCLRRTSRTLPLRPRRTRWAPCPRLVIFPNYLWSRNYVCLCSLLMMVLLKYFFF